jgi:hypothetical protein
MKCVKCQHEAMVPANTDDAECTLSYLSRGVDDWTEMECAYCGAKSRCGDYADLTAAVRDENGIRAHYARVLRREREKVARLQEGRW